MYVRKLISPLIYPVFLIPIFIITLLVVTFSERVYGFIFPGTGEVESLLTIALAGGLLLSVANMIMQKIEGLEEPQAEDHFRQSSLLYIGILLGTLRAISIYPTQGRGLAFGMLLVTLIAGGIAITVNALYLYAVRAGINKRMHERVKPHRTTITLTFTGLVLTIVLCGFFKYSYWSNRQDMLRPILQDQLQAIVSVPLSKEDAIAAVQQAYPESQKYPSDSLPPTSIETENSSEGWYVAFVQNGSGRPILSARCFKVTFNKQVIATGTYAPTQEQDKVTFSAKDCN